MNNLKIVLNPLDFIYQPEFNGYAASYSRFTIMPMFIFIKYGGFSMCSLFSYLRRVSYLSSASKRLNATFLILAICITAVLSVCQNIFAQNLAETNLATAPQASEVYVQVQVAKIRQSPKPWASGIAEVKFGDKLVELANQDSWLRVKNAQDLEGFLHSTAVTGKKIILSASKEDLLNSSVDEPDVYLAGKGFNNEVLKELASNEPTLNFAAVDTMQKQAIIDENTFFSFVKNGQLNKGQK